MEKLLETSFLDDQMPDLVLAGGSEIPETKNGMLLHGSRAGENEIDEDRDGTLLNHG